MKLFEIPVYAMSKEKLNSRVTQFHQKFIKENELKASPETIDIAISSISFPQRLWEYNHIIGYIVVKKESNDIRLEWYTNVPKLQKYYWRTKKKIFFQNTHLNGFHFYIGNMKTGNQLQMKLTEMLKDFEKDLLIKGYYADMEAFNNIDAMLDYEKVLRS